MGILSGKHYSGIAKCKFPEMYTEGSYNLKINLISRFALLIFKIIFVVKIYNINVY